MIPGADPRIMSVFLTRWMVRTLEEGADMLEFLTLIGGGLLLIGLPGLAYPALVGWKTRRDAGVVLLISAALLLVVIMN
jgi:hypothetical protein